MTEPYMRFIEASGALSKDEVPIYIKRSRLRTLRRDGVAWLVRGIWVGVIVGNARKTAVFCAFNKARTFDGGLVDMPRHRLGVNDDATSLLDVQIYKIATGAFEPHTILREVEREISLIAMTHPSACCPEGIPYTIHALDTEPRQIACTAFRENRL